MAPMTWLRLFYGLFALLKQGNCINTSNHHETRLQHYLFDGYNSHVRPSVNGRSIEVGMSVYLNSVIKLDEIRQILRVALSYNFAWKDDLLQWKGADFGGLESVVIPAKMIWLPDILLYNAVEDAYVMGVEDSVFQLEHDGNVNLWSQKTSEVRCEIRTKKFPFDQHTCQLMFAMSGNGDSNVKLVASERLVSLEWYESAAGWDIAGNSVETDTNYDDRWGANFTNLKYALTFKRNCKMCILNTVLPVVLLSMLNLLTFLVPIACGEKLAFPMSIFLTVAVFLSVINGSLPEAIDGVSYLAIWVSLKLGFCGLTLSCTVFIIRLQHCGESSEVPDNIANMVRCLRNKSAFCTLSRKRKTDNVAVNSRKDFISGKQSNENGELNSRTGLDTVLESQNGEEHNEIHVGKAGMEVVRWSDVSEVVDRLMLIAFFIGHLFTDVFFIVQILF